MVNLKHPGVRIAGALTTWLLLVAAVAPKIDWNTQIKNKPTIPVLPIDWNTEIKNRPIIPVLTPDYKFAAQAPGGSLGVGTNTITMAPVPLGTNGSDTNHWLYVSAGTGTAEPCLITGGAGTAGQASGQIIIQCVNAHSGPWTVQSATGGIQEAIIGAGSGTVFLPAGTYTLYAHPIIPSGMNLAGAGASSILRVASGAWGPPATALQWRSPCDAFSSTAVSTTAGAAHVMLQDFTLDANGVGQPDGYGFDVSLCAATNSSIERVRVMGARHQGSGLATLAAGKDNRIINSIANGAGIAVGTCTGGVFIQGLRQRAQGNYVDGVCDDAYVINGAGSDDGVFEGNTYVGSAASTVPGFHVEDASRTTVIGNTCIGTVGTNWCVFISAATAGLTQTDVLVSGNTIIGAPIIAFSTVASNAFARLTIAHNIVRDSPNGGILVLGTVTGGIITENQIRNNGLGISITSNAALNSQVIISHNYIDHSNNVGIRIAGSGANAPGQEFIVTNNVSTDTSVGGAKVQVYGMDVFPQVQPETQFIVTGNDFTGNSTGALNFVGGMSGTATNSIIKDNLGAGFFGGLGAALASAGTITPTNKIHHVTGTAAINTITAPGTLYPGDTLTLIPDAAYTLTATGNIYAASTAVVGKAMLLTWDGTKWGSGY